MKRSRDLRAYQRSDIARIRAAMKVSRRVLYVLPTGGGKTTVAGYMVEQWLRAGKRVLFLVHRHELLEQAYRTLTQKGDSGFSVERDSVGVIWQRDRRTNSQAPVQIASIDTLVRRACPTADFVVLDEAHRSVAKKWRKITDGWYRDTQILGLTATPERLDGTPLREAFDEMVMGVSVSTLIEGEYLREPKCFVRELERRVDVKGVHVSRLASGARDYVQTELERRAERKWVLAEAPKYLRERGGRRNGIVFACGVRHAKKLVATINRSKHYQARLLLGVTPEHERRKILDPRGWLDTGTCRVVVTCDLLNEGFDLPSVKLAVLIRPTLSEALYLHQVGRILRPTDRNEHQPVILDLAGNCLRFGPPQWERQWSLDGREVPASPITGRLPVAKRCAECDAVCAVSATCCPDCGTEFPARDPDERKGQLVELSVPCAICGEPATGRVPYFAKIGATKGYCKKHLGGVRFPHVKCVVCGEPATYKGYCAEHKGKVPILPCHICGQPATYASSYNARLKKINPYCVKHKGGHGYRSNATLPIVPCSICGEPAKLRRNCVNAYCKKHIKYRTQRI